MAGELSVLLPAARRLSVSVIWDRCRGNAWIPEVALTNYTPHIMLAGPVFPVRTKGAILPVLQALAVIPRDHVLVVQDQVGGNPSRALLGDIIMLAAKQQGIAGIICFGRVRDVKEADALGMPLWAVGTTPVPAGVGEPVSVVPDVVLVGSERISLGDWVFGDCDGLIVVPGLHARHVIKAAGIKDKRERLFKDRLRAGEVLHEMMDVHAHLSKRTPLKVDF